jgi:hypothetical protein
MPSNRTVNDIKFCGMMLLIDAKMFSFFHTDPQFYSDVQDCVCRE